MSAPTSVIPVAPAPRKSTSTIVAWVASAVLLLSTGVTTTLYMIQRGESTKLNSQVTTLNSDATTLQSKIDTLQRDLDGTKRDLTAAKDANEGLTGEKTIMADCLRAVETFLLSTTEAQAKERFVDVNRKCPLAFDLAR